MGIAALAMGAACNSDSGGDTVKHTVTVTKAGAGAGTVTSAPSGITCGTTCEADFDQGATVTLTAAPSTGSAFTGWTGATGCTTAATCVVTVSADIGVTATFAVGQQTLRVFAWGGGSTSVAPGVHKYDYGTVVTLTATADAGATFTGWSTGATAATTTVTMDGDKLIGARFFDAATTSTLPVPTTGTVAQPAGAAGGLEVIDWAGFAGAVTYTFDDGLSTQEINYQALKDTGEKFTFFIVPGMEEMYGKLASWQHMAADGNEMGNHTKTHCHVSAAGALSDCIADWAQAGQAPETTPAAEIDYTDNYIKTTLGQAGVFTMASPWGEATWDTFAGAAGYIANRDIGGDPTDLLHFPSTLFGKESWGGPGWDTALITAKIDTAVTDHSWQVFLFHGIGTPQALDTRTNPTGSDPEGCCEVPIENIVASIEYAQGLTSPVWIGRMMDVAAYQLGQKIVSEAASTTANGATTWKWALPANFPPGKFVRVTVTGGVLLQKGQVLPWNSHGYYEVALDAGELTLDSGYPCTLVTGLATSQYGDTGVGLWFEPKDGSNANTTIDFLQDGVNAATGVTAVQPTTPYVVSIDVFVPSTAAAPTNMAAEAKLETPVTIDSDSRNVAKYNKWPGLAGTDKNKWVTLSWTMGTGSAIEFGALGSTVNAVEVLFGTSAAADPVSFCFKNFKVTHGASTANVVFNPYYFPRGTGAGGTGSPAVDPNAKM